MEISIAIAFLAGVVSFLSPCVLPIIPGFLAYLAGSSLDEEKPNKKDIFLNSLFFVIGFSVVFAILGVLLNTLLEAVAFDVQIWLARIGGTLIIFFGLYLVGLLKIPFLERAHTIKVKKKFKSRYFTSFLFGLAFAVGWTPCVGAALGAILGLAVTAPGSAFVLLLSYAIGLGIPFLVIGLFATQASGFINKYAKTLRYVNIGFGIILIILGLFVFTQSLNLISDFSAASNLLQ
ncbi:cytochrome C biogenesis protein [Candidatus Wolfebacteria bacterium]|nr:MAG: cytochrome C biogenesis protein [Candidatus Wolfebacteria bacterium]